MHWSSAHRPDVAHIDCDSLVSNRVGWMEIADKVGVLRNQVGAENGRIAGGEIEHRSVVADAYRRVFLLLKFLADRTDEGAFPDLPKIHTMASALLRKREVHERPSPWSPAMLL